ncbi:MAG: hypothetical protein HC905_18545 [Bacteroidales bacterium]|nr:hypothetical protein [Bacteroidales bacterium]
MFPFADSSGLYFSSDVHMGLGGLDVFFSACKNDNEFTVPVNPGAPLNSEKDDFSFFLNADKRTGYIASNRPGGLGDDDIYSFTLSSIRFSGIIKDSTENTVIAYTPVYLYNAAGKLVDSTTTVSDGSFVFPLAYDKEYALLIKNQV